MATMIHVMHPTPVPDRCGLERPAFWQGEGVGTVKGQVMRVLLRSLGDVQQIACCADAESGLKRYERHQYTSV
ncbi:hypothetical protein [Xanthomonas hortorum]|uniref:Uncharacterized protein n=1 Tax=Xanthomonas hortorum pv. pelargonii TaxID=453602 RepID=A0AAW9ZTE4_9XANT|nr:hypothetical protein [Xanthomonas hortorum]MCM5548783.1 hypothetical protein [Xanthomonas hortorum pv. pelargonii]NMI23173.1 hypothetical protein [Xanthomonas hortorum pv. pelargonii]UUE99969.1 hypothetical protein NDY24_09920 [Xanthomonas hortorum pv. pelargonii]